MTYEDTVRMPTETKLMQTIILAGGMVPPGTVTVYYSELVEADLNCLKVASGLGVALVINPGDTVWPAQGHSDGRNLVRSSNGKRYAVTTYRTKPGFVPNENLLHEYTPKEGVAVTSRDVDDVASLYALVDQAAEDGYSVVVNALYRNMGVLGDKSVTGPLYDYASSRGIRLSIHYDTIMLKGSAKEPDYEGDRYLAEKREAVDYVTKCGTQGLSILVTQEDHEVMARVEGRLREYAVKLGMRLTLVQEEELNCPVELNEEAKQFGFEVKSEQGDFNVCDGSRMTDKMWDAFIPRGGRILETSSVGDIDALYELVRYAEKMGASVEITVPHGNPGALGDKAVNEALYDYATRLGVAISMYYDTLTYHEEEDWRSVPYGEE
jgi:hypothetical protein